MRSSSTKISLAFLIVSFFAFNSVSHAHPYPPPPPRYYPPPPPQQPHWRSQRGFVPELYFGGSLGGTAVVEQSGGPDVMGDGGGGSLFIGVRAHPHLALELGVFDSFHDSSDTSYYFGDYRGRDSLVLSALTADALFHLGPPRNVDPYLQLGMGLYGLGRDYMGTRIDNWGFQAGGGVDFWLGSNVTIGGRLLYRGIIASEEDSSRPDTFMHTISAEAKLAFHFR